MTRNILPNLEKLSPDENKLDLQELEKQFQDFREKNPKINQDLAGRLCGTSIPLIPLINRFLDAVAITSFYIRERDIDLDPRNVLYLASVCEFGNARNIKTKVEEYALLLEGGVCDKAQGPPIVSFQKSIFLQSVLENTDLKETVLQVSDQVNQLCDLWNRKPGPGRPKNEKCTDENIVKALNET